MPYIVAVLAREIPGLEDYDRGQWATRYSEDPEWTVCWDVHRNKESLKKMYRHSTVRDRRGRFV